MKVVNVKNVAIGQGMTKVCVPVVAATDYDVDYQIRLISKSKTDIVEFRADCYENCLDEDALMATLKKIHEKLGKYPIIFTFRTKSEGGEQEATISQYENMLMKAIDSGYIDLVDVEYFSGQDVVERITAEAHNKGVYVISSNHDFKTTIPMEQIVGRYKDMIATGADIAKIAMMPEDGSQVVDMMQAAKELQESGNETPLIVISMGELGVETRTTGEMYGNSVSFATAGIPSAPGQIDVEALRSQLEMIHHIIGG
ncbi:MAG: type I 3-dehydroquinate dehydratase [Coprococcus sp.]|nr:type I 3-dehydroquinate dehydratase [Coprococcus sp.]